MFLPLLKYVVFSFHSYFRIYIKYCLLVDYYSDDLGGNDGELPLLGKGSAREFCYALQAKGDDSAAGRHDNFGDDPSEKLSQRICDHKQSI